MAPAVSPRVLVTTPSLTKLSGLPDRHFKRLAGSYRGGRCSRVQTRCLTFAIELIVG